MGVDYRDADGKPCDERGLRIVRDPAPVTPPTVRVAVLDAQLEKRRREIDRAKRNKFLSFLVWWASITAFGMFDPIALDIPAIRICGIVVFFGWSVGALLGAWPGLGLR